MRAQRSIDKKLDAALRVNSVPWIKRRNEEVYPVLYLARHLRLPEATRYRLTPEGDAADVELDRGEHIEALQVTTAGPIWPDGPENWGADHVLHMQQLNREGQSFGWGPNKRQSDGSIHNRGEAISSKYRDAAYDEAMSVFTFLDLAQAALREALCDGFADVVLLSAGEGYFARGDRSLGKRNG